MTINNTPKKTAKLPRAWMSWSSGKDSTLALHEARVGGEVDVVGLLTTINAAAERVSMHEVRRKLLEQQAEALGLPLHVVELPWPCPNKDYEDLMSAALFKAKEDNVDTMVFGDLFLEDIRQYRESKLEGTGVTPVFPLWLRPTPEVAQNMLDLGLQAIVACVNLSKAPKEIAGRWFDKELLDSLPKDVDPCGEYGEFHTVVVNGPGFSHPIEVEVGEIVERNGFAYADVIPKSN